MLRALLVMPTKTGTWLRMTELPFAPFPGLGIRVDVYDVLNVDSVLVGDARSDVTCIVHLEGASDGASPEQCAAFGFEMAPYP